MASVRLTEREVEVLALISQGLSNRQIAARLILEQSTVRWYARQIYAKLGAENRRHAVQRARETGVLPDVEPLPQPRHNLPAAVTTFVGREHELAQLGSLLDDPAVRLITIVGPGGIGKTRLSLAAAEAQLVPRVERAGAFSYLFPDGVWFVPLAEVNRPEGLAAAIAAALGLPLEGHIEKEPLGQLRHYLRQKRILLVLDNFEQLAEAAPQLTELVIAGAGVKLLITSRERLELQGEQVFPIEGLTVPGNTGHPILEIDGFPAVQLFLHTARRVQPGLELAEGDRPHLVRICRAVDGNPLAIELAASWASVLPLESIADEIEGNLSALAAGTRDMPARHRSIRAALEASWQRLEPEQQAAFLRLSIFSGGFTRLEAHEIAGTTMPLLVQLVFKSWLVYDQKADRYRIHELLRQYGRQLLAADPGLEAMVRSEHAAYFMAFLKGREADFHHSRQAEVVLEIRAEEDNIRQAWDWVIAERDMDQMDRGLDALCQYLAWVGRIRDADLACRAVVEALAGFDGAEADPAVLALRIKALLWQITFTWSADTKTRLLAQCRALLDRAAALGMDIRREWAGLYLRLAYEEADVNAALRYFETAFDLFHSLGDGPGMSKAKIDQAHALMRLSSLEQAEAAAAESLAIRQRMGDRLGTADSQAILALVYKHREQPEKAEALQLEALQLYQTYHHPIREMSVAGDLAHTLWWLGRFEEMLKMAEHAIALQDSLGIDPDPFYAITVSWALLHLGRYQEAERVASQALVDARITGSLFTPQSLMVLGQVAAVTGSAGFNAPQFREGLAGMMALWPNEAAQYMAVCAYLSLSEGNRPQAVADLRQALRWAYEHQSYDSGLYCLPAAALLIAPTAPERAIELHTLSRTFAHIKNSCWFSDVAARRLEEVAAGLGSEIAGAARQRGRTLDLWGTVHALATGLR